MVKVCIVVLDSITGQTHQAGKLIADGIVSHSRPSLSASDVIVHSIRCLPSSAPLSSRSSTPAAIASLSEAEVVGFGTPVIGYHATDAVVDWLTRTLPSEAVRWKRCFVFATYGSHPGACLEDIARPLRGKGANVVAQTVVLTPDTFLWFLPRNSRPGKSSPLRWAKQSADVCKEFGSHVASLAESAGQVAEVDTTPTAVGKALSLYPNRLTCVLTGDVAIDSEACTMCGRCTRKCPSGALTMDTAKRSPAWDSRKCIGCAVCVGTCPNGAIGVPCGSNRVFPPSARGEDIGHLLDRREYNAQWWSMLLRFLGVAVFRRPFATAHAALAFVVALFHWAFVSVFGTPRHTAART